MPQRAHLRAEIANTSGDVQQTLSVHIYEYGTTTPFTDPMYSARTGGIVLPNPLTTDGNGIVEAWADYARPVTIAVSGSGLEASVSGEFLLDQADPLVQTLAVKGRAPWVDVRAWGAVGDGNQILGSIAGTDDTAAIQAACTYAGLDPYVSFPVYLPAGVYNAKDLRVPPGTILRGAGWGMTVLKRSAARVTSIKVTNGGTGYTSDPAVGITGGGGSGATATVTRVGGVITHITLVNQGDNYTADPSVSITGGGGSGATATASCAFISETDTGSGAAGIQLHHLSVDGNNLGTHGVALGYSSQAAGPQWAFGATMTHVKVRKCLGGDGLKLYTNVASMFDVWSQECDRDLFWEGTTLYTFNLNLESAISYEARIEGSYGTFVGTQIETGSSDRTGTVASVLFGTGATDNDLDAFISLGSDFTGDMVRLSSGSIGNKVNLRPVSNGHSLLTGFVANDLNDATSGTHWSLSNLSAEQRIYYEQAQRRTVIAGGLQLSGRTGHSIVQHYISLANGGGATQAHPTIANPDGHLLISDGGHKTAIFALENSTTRLVDGDAARWAGGTSLGGASKTTVYVTGGAVIIANQTATNPLAYELKFLAGPLV